MRILLLFASLSMSALAAGVPDLTEPALCPTRPEIANDLYRVSADGGTPIPVGADRLRMISGGARPDGATLAFAARVNGGQQGWRKDHSHLDESEIWIRKEGSPSTYERVVDLNGRNVWPMWMPDGRRFYFMPDRGGAQNIWSLALGGKPRR